MNITEWETDCDPMNNEIVLVELVDGTRTLAYQYFGEWNDLLRDIGFGPTDIKKWRYFYAYKIRGLLAELKDE